MYRILSSKRFYGHSNNHIFARNENIQDHPENNFNSGLTMTNDN
jgi:hypothetical protein